MIAFKNPADDDESPGGSGGDSRRNENGRSVIQDQRLVDRAVREGWIDKRWDTNVTVEKLQAIQRERPLTLKEMALLQVMSGLNKQDQRIAQIAVRSAVAMEAQNQADEHEVVRHLVGGDRDRRSIEDLSSDRLRAIILEESSGSGVAETPNGNGKPD